MLMIPFKTIIKVLINTALGLILVLIWLRFVNIQEVLTTLSRVELEKVIPIYIFTIISLLIRSFRLKLLLSKIKKIKFLDLFFLNGAGLMINFLIPIRAGEIAKGVYLHSQYDLPFGKSLVWIFIDRLIDFLVVIILAAVFFLIIPTKLPNNFPITLSAAFAVFTGIVYLMVYQTNLARKLFRFLSHLLIFSIIKRYFERIYEFFLDAFSILKRKPIETFILLITTSIAYLSESFIWYFAFLAIGSKQEILNMYLGQLLSALTYLVPAAPGYIGSAEASGLLIFSGVFGIEPNLASSMVVLFHVTTAIFVIVFGIISVYSLNLDLREIFRKVLNRK